ncbi:MAG: hypothetical protein QM528_02820 [Phycisphaerales bacterium]|nr:hypothetical protein [Phycisphaerales bacterium]
MVNNEQKETIIKMFDQKIKGRYSYLISVFWNEIEKEYIINNVIKYKLIIFHIENSLDNKVKIGYMQIRQAVTYYIESLKNNNKGKENPTPSKNEEQPNNNNSLGDDFEF